MSTLTPMTIPSGESISKAGRTITVKRLKTPQCGDSYAAVDTVEICYNKSTKHIQWFPDVQRCEKKAQALINHYLDDKDSLGTVIPILDPAAREKHIASLRKAREALRIHGSGPSAQ